MEDKKKHIRLRVQEALTRHLSGISIANGYEHDLTTSCFRGRAVYGKDDTLPLLSILEGKGNDYGSFADQENTIRKDDLVLLVQGFVKDDRYNPTDPAYGLLHDVEKRLSDIINIDRASGKPKYPGVYNLGGLITSLVMASPVVRPAEDGVSSTAFFYLPIRVGMTVDLTNPSRGAKELNR